MKKLNYRPSLSALTAILLFLILIGSSFAQDKTGSVTGTIVDKTTGVPIEGADITLNRVKDSSLVKGISSDASG